jgi:hypothetical protein
MAKSKKPAVIEWIYNQLVDPKTGVLTRTVVTKRDITNGIQAAGAGLSPDNPVNFIKDVIRGQGASRMWPDSLKALRITAVQVTGGGNVFEFVPYADGQVEPFPSPFGYHSAVDVVRLQSISVPLATKQLGRDDETYLIQVAVKLGIIESHFALTSPLDMIEMNHLQIGIKLRKTEIDSLYSALLRNPDGTTERVLVTAEAKKRNQRILEEQVVQQVKAAFGITEPASGRSRASQQVGPPVDLVVPVAMTSAAHGIYVAEFKPVRRADADKFEALELVAEALYELVPPVKGI